MKIKYRKIFLDLLEEIRKGEYKPKEIMPSETALMKKYEVSRDTVRKALNLLENEGYITKKKGLGSIVIDSRRLEFPVSSHTSFKELKNKMGGNIKTKIISLQKKIPNQKIKDLLKLDSSQEVYILTRVRYIDDEAVILDIDYLNSDIVSDLPIEMMSNSLYEYLEKTLKLKISLAEKNITCENITSLDEKYLDLKDFTMIMNIDSLVYLDNGQVFQYTISRHRPDKFKFKNFARRIKI